MMAYEINQERLDYVKKISGYIEKLKAIREENDCDLGLAVNIMYNQEINYQSGWVIEFESGREIICDEYNYNLYKDTKDVSKDKAICEAHYFLLSDAIKRNPKIREYFIRPEIFEKLKLGRDD